MPFDAQGNWIPQEAGQNLPAVRVPAFLQPDYSTDTLGIPQAPSQEESDATRASAIKHTVAVLDFLHRFNAQSNALWGGAYGGLYGADQEDAPPDFWTGLKQGAGVALGRHAPDINLSDVLGMRQPTGDQPWLSMYDTETGKYNPGWLQTAALKLGVDLIGDPLTYEFTPAGSGTVKGVTKSAGLLSRGIKAAFPFLREGQSLGGKALELTRIPQIAENLSLRSGLDRAAGHGYGTDTAASAVDQMQREAGLATQQNRGLVDQAQQAVRDMGIGPEKDLDLYHALERPLEEVPGIPREAKEAVAPVITQRDKDFQALNEARMRSGKDPIPNISDDDYTQILHRFFGKGPMDKATREPALGKMREWNTEEPQSRELFRWINPETGEEVLPGVVSKAEAKYLNPLGMSKDPKTGGWVFKEPGTQAPRPTPIDVPPGDYLKPIEEGQYMGLDEADALLRQIDQHPNLAQNKAYGYVPGKKIPVEPTNQVTMRDVLEAKNLDMDRLMAETNPLAALGHQMQKQQEMLSLERTKQALKDTGDITPLESVIPQAGGRFAEGEVVRTGSGLGTVVNSNRKTSFVAIGEDIHEFPNELLQTAWKKGNRLPWEQESLGDKLDRAKDWLYSLTQPPEPRQINVKGLEAFQAHPKTANRLENSAGAPFEPKSLGGIFHDTAEKIRYSVPGELHHTALQTWKRTTLARIARWFMDEMSRLSQINSEGNVSLWRILAEHANTWRVRSPKLSETFGDSTLGIPNQAWRETELPARGLMGELSGSRYGTDEIARLQGPGFFERNIQDIPVIGKPLTALAKGWGTYNEAMLAAVRKAEENHKIAVFFDQLRKNHPNIGELYKTNYEEFGRRADEAARFSKNTMGDYTRGAHTPTENLAIEGMPFYRWWRYAVPTVAANAIQHPERYSRMDRFYNTLFDAMTPEEYQNSPDWKKEQAVVKGFAGKTLDEWAAKPLGEYTPDWLSFPARDEPRTASIGRGMHVQHLNELTISPVQSMLSKVDPLLKVAMELGLNKNFFLKRPIDTQVAADKDAPPFAALGRPWVSDQYDPSYHTVFGFHPSAGAEHLYGSLMPGGIQLKEYNELLRGLTASAGLPLFQDPNKNETNIPEALIAFLTGRKIYGWNPEKDVEAKQYEAADARQALVRALKQATKKENEYNIDHYTRALEEFDDEHGGIVKRPKRK